MSRLSSPRLGTRLTTSVATACLAATLATGCAALADRYHANQAAKHPKTADLQPGDTAYVDPGPFDGPLAQKYAGKVVFSSAPIALKDSDDHAAYATYTLGDPLFVRYWGAQSIHNLRPRCNNPRVFIDADVNGEAGGDPRKVISLGYYQADEAHLDQRPGNALTNKLDLPLTTALPYDPGEREVAGESVVRAFNSAVVESLHEGKNQLHLEIKLDCSGGEGAILASGDLPVDVKPGTLASYIAKYGPQLAPSHHPENDALSAKIVEVMKHMSDWDNEDVKLARVTSRSWEPVRNDLGILVQYEVEAVIVVHAKAEPHEQKCRIFNMSYRRDAAGGPLSYAGTGTPKPFPCANATATASAQPRPRHT